MEAYVVLSIVVLLVVVYVRVQRRKPRSLAGVEGNVVTLTPTHRPTPAQAVPPLTGPGIPLCMVNGHTIGIRYGDDAGHISVIAPTRSGKGLHATETLLQWPGAVVAVDPKLEQYQRTAGLRDERVGPVYTLPGDSMDLLDYYNLANPLDMVELFDHLMQPHKDKDPVFVNKARPLFDAAYRVGRAMREHPLLILARWANGSPVLALTEAQQYAPNQVAQFTDGTALDEFDRNRFAVSSWGTFTSRFGQFAPFMPMFSQATIPHDWADQGASIYVGFPMQQLKAAAPLIAAAIAAFMRGQMQRTGRTPVLLLIDEMPTVALNNLVEYLATMGGYGITALLYAQSLTQVEDVYKREGSRALLGNCLHQLWYTPRDVDTAKYISDAYGNEKYRQTTISHYPHGQRGPGQPQGHVVPPAPGQIGYSYSEAERPVLAPAQIMQLAEDNVICFTKQGAQPTRFVGQRMDGRGRFKHLPPPPTARVTVLPPLPRPHVPSAADHTARRLLVGVSSPPAPVEDEAPAPAPAAQHAGELHVQEVQLDTPLESSAAVPEQPASRVAPEPPVPGSDKPDMDVEEEKEQRWW